MNTTTNSAVNDILAKFGLTIQSTGGMVTKDGEWERLTFAVQVSKGDKQVWSGSYHLGLGHVKIPKGFSGAHLTEKEQSMLRTLQSKPNAKFYPEADATKASLYSKLATAQKLKPSLPDVMHAILSDGSAHFDSMSFEEWCSDLGYDTDSRKAESVYRACDDTGKALLRAFSAAEIQELREAFSEY